MTMYWDLDWEHFKNFAKVGKELDIDGQDRVRETQKCIVRFYISTQIKRLGQMWDPGQRGSRIYNGE